MYILGYLRNYVTMLSVDVLSLYYNLVQLQEHVVCTTVKYLNSNRREDDS